MLDVPRTNLIVRTYFAAVSFAGLAMLGATFWNDRASLLDPSILEVTGFLLLFTFLLSLAPIPTRSGVNLSVTLAPMFAAVLVLPPGLAALIACLGSIDRRIPGRQISWRNFLFNRGQFSLAYACATLVLHSLRTLQATPGSGGLTADLQVFSAGLIALVVIILINTSTVIVALSLSTGQSARKIAYQTLQGALLSYVGLAPLGALLAYLVSPSRTSNAITRYEGLAISAVVFLLLMVYRELARQTLKLHGAARQSYVAQSRLIDKKDQSTFGHSERVGLLAESVAAKMRLPSELVEQIRIGATLHDLGKIAIPDAILHKLGKLTDEEWRIIRTHPVEGYDVLHEQEVLEEAARIVRSHHENFDGSGYPDGVQGRAIPVGGRITRVVDSYDCVTNARSYRESVKDPFDALSELHSLKGTHYDPEVVDALTVVLMERYPSRELNIPGVPTTGSVSIRQVINNPRFMRFLTAFGLSNFGDMLTTTGLALVAFGPVHSTLAAAAVFATRALPNLVLGLLAGQIVDHYERKTVMILMDLVRALLVISLPFLLLAHASLVLILAITLLVSIASVLFNPARSAVLPDLLPHAHLQQGNSIVAFVERTTEILGYAVAGALIFWASTSLLFAIDGMTFLLSAALLTSLNFPDLVRGASEALSWARVRDEIREGLEFIGGNQALRVIFPFSFLMAASASALLPLIVPLAIDHLGASAAGFPLLEASIAFGATIGAAAIALVDINRRGLAMIFGGLTMGLSMVLAGLANTLLLAMLFLVVGGVANMAYLIPMMTAIQEETPSEVRGRVFATRFAVIQLGVLVGQLYAALATYRLDPKMVGLVVVSVGVVMMLVSAAAGLSRSLRKV
jgi:putative nucleotidyltransferase with HDIG domain